MELKGDVIERNARQHPDKVAFVDDRGRRLTWSQYADRCRRMGSALWKAGLRRQERYAVLAMNCLEYYELYSRIFSGEGHAFAPWAMPVRSPKEAS